MMVNNHYLAREMALPREEAVIVLGDSFWWLRFGGDENGGETG